MTDEVFAVYRGIRCVCSLPGGTPGFADVAWFVGTVRGDVVVSNARANLLGITLVGLLIFCLLERTGIYPRTSLMTFFVTRLGFDHLVFNAKFSLVAANQRPGLETRGYRRIGATIYHDRWCHFCASICVLWRLCVGDSRVCRVCLFPRFPACAQLPPIRLETNGAALYKEWELYQ